jgi:hypothetical protein
MQGPPDDPGVIPRVVEVGSVSFLFVYHFLFCDSFHVSCFQLFHTFTLFLPLTHTLTLLPFRRSSPNPPHYQRPRRRRSQCRTSRFTRTTCMTCWSRGRTCVCVSFPVSDANDVWIPHPRGKGLPIFRRPRSLSPLPRLPTPTHANTFSSCSRLRNSPCARTKQAPSSSLGSHPRR